MKKIMKIMLFYIIFSLTLIVLISIPPKIPPEATENHVRYIMNIVDSTNSYIEERYPNMPVEIREGIEGEVDGMIEEIARSSYENTGTFGSRFLQNLKGFGIVLIGVVIVMLLGKERYRY